MSAAILLVASVLLRPALASESVVVMGPPTEVQYAKEFSRIIRRAGKYPQGIAGVWSVSQAPKIYEKQCVWVIETTAPMTIHACLRRCQVYLECETQARMMQAGLSVPKVFSLESLGRSRDTEGRLTLVVYVNPKPRVLSPKPHE